MVYPDEHEEAEEAGDGQRQIADDVAKLDEAALPQLVTDRETKTHRRGRSRDRRPLPTPH
jgi:hypothetical protein